MTWTPWHFLVVAISGWRNWEQQVIDYLGEENRILREELGHVMTARQFTEAQAWGQVPIARKPSSAGSK